MNRDIVPVLVGGFGEINFGKQFRQGNRVYDADSVAVSLMAQPVGNRGGNSYLYVVGGGENMDVTAAAIRGRPEGSGGYKQAIEISDNQWAHTLTTTVRDSMVYSECKIRKLTPRECFRLMGFTDDEFDRAESVNSNAQLYKQAGNSIVVNVLEHIFRAIYTDDGEMYI